MVNVQIIDIREVDIAGSEIEKFQGPADELLVGMRFMVRRLFEVPYEGEGKLRLMVSEEEARVTLNEQAFGETPDMKIPERLAAGKHALSVEKRGYYNLLRETYIEPGRISSVDLKLVKMPVPWYKTWWFWTLAGTVTAGAATTTTYFLTRPEPTPKSGDVTATVPNF